jgi:tetratricopeptide (TPR) repeat protein
MSTPYIWVECTSWELDFFGLPHRIPWPTDVDPKKANEEPFDHEVLARAIDLMGPDATAPWTTYRAASDNFDALAEVLEDHEFPEAETLLNELEEAHPGTSFVAFHRGVIARQDGRFDEAIGHYEDAARKTPGIGMIWLHLGTLLAQEGHREKAISALNNAVRCNPQDTNALEALASLRAAVKVLRDPNDPKSAVYVSLQQYQQLSGQQLQQIRDNPQALLEFAEFQLRNQLATDTGIKALERARELQPQDPRTLAALSNGYRMAERHGEAKAIAQELTERFPTEPQAWLNLAQILGAAEDKAGERAALEKLLTLDPEAQAALGILSGLNEGPSTAAEQWLAKHAEQNKSPVAWLFASNSARDRKDTQAALDYAARAFEAAPEREDVLLHYCAMIGDAKDSERLFRDIEPAIQSGKFSKRLEWNFAQALKQLGRVQDAVHALIEAASGENVPEDFQHAATSTIDLWTGRLAQSELPLAVSKAGTIARPVVLNLDGEDGAVVLNAGQTIPAEARFPWRVRLNSEGETRVTLQQGQTGGTIHPTILGTFAIKVPPVTGGAHTLQCLLGVGPDARMLFKAIQGARELPVRWIAPAAELSEAHA